MGKNIDEITLYDLYHTRDFIENPLVGDNRHPFGQRILMEAIMLLKKIFPADADNLRDFLFKPLMVKKEISEKERELFKEMLLKPITELKAEKASLEEKKEKMNIEKQMVLEDLIAFKNSL